MGRLSRRRAALCRSDPVSRFDAERFKANERAGFNRIAARYLDASASRAALQAALIEQAAPVAGERVLDLASGPCLLAADAARRVGPGGLVIASDIAEGMLAVGRSALPPEALGPMRFCAADGEHLPFADGGFDLVTIGLGLFVFPHAERALAEIRRILVPGGRLAVSVWGARETVPLIAHAQDCIARLIPPPRVPRPSVFRLGEPGALEALLSTAGLAVESVAPWTLPCRFASPADYWQGFLDLAGGAAESLSRLPADVQARLRDEVAREVEGCWHDGQLVADSQILLALARR
ncbi:MAG: class I SAM-dependent methyltransferase [Rhodocyclaceae bacterium]|nr:class I SAM-dependent methyltransferase [Rhodocyclaceae bacterium]